jgi:hypothetical protein
MRWCLRWSRVRLRGYGRRGIWMPRDAFACHAGAAAQAGAKSVPFGFPNASAKLKFNFSGRIEATPESH